METRITRRRVVQFLTGTPLFLPALNWAALAQNIDERNIRSRAALVIANDQYVKERPLSGVAFDAKLIERTLKNIGFSTKELLLNADRDKMTREICEFRKDARLADIAMIYYAGHAVEVEGRNFVLPVDADMEDGFSASATTIELSMIMQAVGFARTFGVVVLDACRNNPFVEQMKSDGNVNRHFSVGLAPYIPAKNILIQYSAAPGQVASDGNGSEASPFARSFASALSSKDIPVVQSMQYVIKDVQSQTANTQSPYFSGSVSDQTLSLNPSRKSPLLSADTIVDLQVADYDDVTVKDLVEYDFSYKFSGLDADGLRIIRPDDPYFDSLAEGRTPRVEAQDCGYFDLEEGTTGWGISFPLIDVVARRNRETTISISELVVDVKRSKPDRQLYIGLAAPSDKFCELVVYNQGWTSVKSARLDFDVFVVEDDNDIEKLIIDKKDGQFRYTKNIDGFSEYRSINFEVDISKELKQFSFYKYAFYNSPSDERPQRGKAPQGYSAWLSRNPHIFDVEKQDSALAVYIIGKMVLRPSDETQGVSTIDVVGKLPIYAPAGLGGGFLMYNAVNSIKLKTDGADYQVRKNIEYLLDSDVKTYRFLMPLIPDQTSDHVLKFSLIGNGGMRLFESEWMNIKAFVPRLSKKYASFVRQ